MSAPRVYEAEDALTVTAFPLSATVGYIVRIGTLDHEGLYLGSVIFSGGRWQAFLAGAEDEGPIPLGARLELDDLVTECFVEQVRLPRWFEA